EDSVLHPVRPDYHTRRDVSNGIDNYLERGFSKLDSIVGEYSSRLFNSIPDTVIRKEGVCPVDSTSLLEQTWSGIKSYLQEKD
ncbi:MAG: hypothetical protein ACLFSN_04620, partial [Candidatus Woesearchaeota archaeon]